MSDIPQVPEPAAVDEVTIDLAAFLPEGTTLARADDDSDEPADHRAGGEPGDGQADRGPVDDGVEPEPVAATEPERDQPIASEQVAADRVGPVGPEPTEPTEPRPPEPVRPPVDVAVLERVEADLAAVDAALLAIDAGEPGRSVLLVELLGEAPAGP